MEQVNLLNLIFALAISVLLLMYWRAVLLLLAACLAAVAVLGVLTFLAVLGIHWP